MGDSNIVLSSASQAILDRYHEWSRLSYEEAARGASVDAASQEAGNALRDSYSRAELRGALADQRALLLHALAARLRPFTGAAAALLRAVLRDADRQRVALAVDAAAVLRAGAAGAAGAAGTEAGDAQRLIGGPRGRLAPLTVEDAAGEASRQLAEANDAVRELREEVQRLRSGQTERQMIGENTGDSAGRLAEEDLRGTVDALRAELAEAKRELSVRLSESSQYKHVKHILIRKNELIKTMRAQLEQYDPALLHTGDEDDLEEEED